MRDSVPDKVYAFDDDSYAIAVRQRLRPSETPLEDIIYNIFYLFVIPRVINWDFLPTFSLRETDAVDCCSVINKHGNNY